MQICDLCFLEFPISELDLHREECIKEQILAMNMIEENKPEKPIVPLELTPRQVKSIRFINKKAKIFSNNVKPNLFEKFIRLGYSKDDFNKTIDFVKKHVPLIMHVNLDRTLQFLIDDDHLRNRFETGTSGGSIDIIGRSSWEDKLFNSIYKDAEPFERVKYGAVNMNCNPNGVLAAYQYGSSYFIMNDEVKDRTSFVYGDSSLMDYHISTFKHFCNILFYIPDQGLQSVVDVATERNISNKIANYPYIEAQMHGPIRLDRDVDMLVVNKAFENNELTISNLNKFSEKTGVPWTFMDSI